MNPTKREENILEIFETLEGYKGEKTTCSKSCANTHFRKGWQPDFISHYTTICWRYHEKRCVVCEEDKIVAVHHYDEDHENNDPANLIPLCPTHHQYMHSRFRVEIEQRVLDYILEFRERF